MKHTVSLIALFLSLSSQAQAETMSPSLLQGYKTYFRYHAPHNKEVKNNLYAFPGPIIPYGQAIPVCAAAKTEAAYAGKKELRYISQGKNGWLFRTADFRTDFSMKPQVANYFKELNKLLASRGQKLIVAFQPPRAASAVQNLDPSAIPAGYSAEKAMAGYKLFLRQLNDLGITTVDLSGAPATLPYFAKGDFHWTPEGAEYSAQQVAQAVEDTDAYRKIKRLNFDSEIIGMGPADRGAMEEFIQNTCKINIELTTEPLWQTTVRANNSNDAASLLAEEPFPDVTVLGTSNSAQDDKFNFVGALKRHAQTDVYNASVTGGGFGTSSYMYYASDEYHTHPPRVLIWEFLPQHNYNNAESINAFRQMIPAIQGACTEKNALAISTGPIKAKKTDMFPQKKEHALEGAFLYFELTEPVSRDVKVEILYANGDADEVDLTRSARVDNNGKYFLQLGDMAHKNALFFHLVTDKPEGHLNARLCQYPTVVAGK